MENKSGNGRYRIVLLGSGNVATSLAPALDYVCDVVQIYSRNKSHAQTLADKLRNTRAIDNVEDVDCSADIAIISVPDDAVHCTSECLKDFQGIVAHTSGSVPMDALSACARRGVFYPLQTFSRQRPLSLTSVPFFVEGSTQEATDILKNLASMVSNRVYEADSVHRGALHVAAVFASNFVNHLWDISDELLKPYGYDFSVFGPLVTEVLKKALSLGPHASQTGPAVRHDMKVISTHINHLPKDKANIYRVLTDNIIKNYNNE